MIFSAFPWLGDSSRLPADVRMVRDHSAWLSRVLRGEARSCAPRIPVRRVSEGGFSRMTSTPSGRYRAERWWERALEGMDDSFLPPMMKPEIQ